MKKRFNYKNFLSLIGIGFFIFIIVYVIDLKSLLLTIKRTNYLYFIPIFFLCFPLIGFKAWRWQIIMRKQSINYSFIGCFAMYSVGTLLSLVTPGKIGEAAKIFYLHQDNYPLRSSLITIIFDRLADLIFLILTTYVGFFIFSQYFSQEILYLTLLMIISLIFLYLINKNKNYLKILEFIVPNKYRELIIKNSQGIIGDFKKYNFNEYLFIFFLTFGSWLIYIGQIYLLGLSLGLNLNFLFIIPMVALANTADLLPISFNGLGTREAIFIFFFKIINLPAEKAVALGICQLFIVLSVAAIGFLYWLKKPIKFNLR
ncbi:MAG: lysylphosphatidylglycerol synthase transmembrane domain-containing protein [Patescibacteria group bacterium]|jgi:hypothetical protein